jgi:very-short-patch-repair endonuclease
MCSSPEPVFVRYRELIAGGLRRADIRTSVASGHLLHVRRGVYASPGACASASAAVAHGGVLACVSAARHRGLWVLDDPGESLHVWLRGSGHAYAHGFCECTGHWDDADDDAARDAFGLPDAPRMLAQTLACRGVEAFFVTLESAMRRRMLSTADLDRLRARVNAAGREALSWARDDADSGLESLVRWRLRRFGLRVRTQVSITAVGRVDLLIGDRLIVETDGRENHEGTALRHKDLVRDAHAAAWGYTTLRFDYAMVVHDWDLVERAILAVALRLAPVGS